MIETLSYSGSIQSLLHPRAHGGQQPAVENRGAPAREGNPRRFAPGSLIDVLQTCAPSDSGEGVTCWPQPEYPGNVNRDELGNLGLTGDEENAMLSF